MATEDGAGQELPDSVKPNPTVYESQLGNGIENAGFCIGLGIAAAAIALGLSYCCRSTEQKVTHKHEIVLPETTGERNYLHELIEQIRGTYKDPVPYTPSWTHHSLPGLGDEPLYQDWNGDGRRDIVFAVPANDEGMKKMYDVWLVRGNPDGSFGELELILTTPKIAELNITLLLNKDSVVIPKK